jgi:hypothetical protein
MTQNKELRGRSRGSVGPARGSINGAEDLSKNQYSPVLRQNQADHDNPDYLNIIFSQAIAIELLSSR